MQLSATSITKSTGRLEDPLEVVSITQRLADRTKLRSGRIALRRDEDRVAGRGALAAPNSRFHTSG